MRSSLFTRPFFRSALPFLALVALQTATLAQSTRSESRSFSVVATESFNVWDADHNGTLSPEEIDKLVVDPRIKGEQAAALAAMKLVVRSNKIKPPELTRDFVENHSKDPAGEALPSELKPDPNSADKSNAKPARPPTSLERRYQSALRKIKSAAKPELFADGIPDIDHCRQGPLGDCFFVAGVGAFVHRDAQAVKKMIHEIPSTNGKMTYEVDFPAGQDVTIPPLTDTQFALTSTTGGDGIWLQVLEQAYGSVRNKAKPESKQTQEASDAIAKGGNLGTTLRVLTGHSIDRTRLRSVADKDPGLIDRVKSNLAAAMKDHRLAGAGTGTTLPLPPGVNGKHAYAILGFDQAAGTIELWNPHGNTFKPKGDPGLEHGYETKAGLFKVPAADFVKIFDGMVIETNKPAESAAPAKHS